jgi:hypothetical protein
MNVSRFFSILQISITTKILSEAEANTMKFPQWQILRSALIMTFKLLLTLIIDTFGYYVIGIAKVQEKKIVANFKVVCIHRQWHQLTPKTSIVNIHLSLTSAFMHISFGYFL